MRYILKNKSVVFILFNIALLLLLIGLSLPLYKFIYHIANNNKFIKLSDNEYVKDSVVMNYNLNNSEIIKRKMKVNFNTDVDSSLNWNFKVLQDTMDINVGGNYIVKYEGTNLSERTTTATADFKIEPEIIEPYLIKTECFCFQEQILKPGESQIFTLVFFLDSSLDKDSNLDNIKDLVFTYKFTEFKG